VAVLQHNGGKTPTLLAIYIGAAALLTLVAVFAARETRASDLTAETDPGVSAPQSPVAARAASPSGRPSPEPTI
jgi:hypothetical protein